MQTSPISRTKKEDALGHPLRMWIEFEQVNLIKQFQIIPLAAEFVDHIAQNLCICFGNGM